MVFISQIQMPFKLAKLTRIGISKAVEDTISTAFFISSLLKQVIYTARIMGQPVLDFDKAMLH